MYPKSIHCKPFVCFYFLLAFQLNDRKVIDSDGTAGIGAGRLAEYRNTPHYRVIGGIDDFTEFDPGVQGTTSGDGCDVTAADVLFAIAIGVPVKLHTSLLQRLIEFSTTFWSMRY